MTDWLPSMASLSLHPIDLLFVDEEMRHHEVKWLAHDYIHSGLELRAGAFDSRARNSPLYLPFSLFAFSLPLY